MKEEHRNGRKVVIAFLVVILIVSILLIFWVYNENKSDKSLPFSPEAWDRYPLKRIYMLEDLLRDYNGLAGMTQDDITSLLGENTQTAWKDCYIVGRGDDWTDGLLMTLYFNDTDGTFKALTISQGAKQLYQFCAPGSVW